MTTRIKRWAKPLGVVSAVVGGSLAFAWATSSPPRNMWFEQETVTVTKTVSPWWMDGVTVIMLALLAGCIWIMMSIGPRRI